MGFSAMVETDMGEMLHVWSATGGNGGKAVFAFLSGLATYCIEEQTPIYLEWFSQFEKAASISLCSLAQPLLQSLWTGEWRYTQDEYEIYKIRHPNDQLTEADFLQTVKWMDKTWTPVDKLLVAAEEVLKAFRNAKPHADEAWYDPEWSPADFQALCETLKIFVERRAENARILIL